jgi:flagellar capping protein FliD
VEGVKKRLTEQFAQVDSILATLNQQSTYLSNVLAKSSSG